MIQQQKNKITFGKFTFLVVVGAALAIRMAFNLNIDYNETHIKQAVTYNVETVSEADSPLNAMSGILSCDEHFRLLMPLSKPTNHPAFQAGLTDKPYKITVLWKLNGMLTYKTLEQQFFFNKLNVLYRQLRI